MAIEVTDSHIRCTFWDTM